MFSVKSAQRITVWAGIAAIGLVGAACTAQQSGAAQSTSEVGGAQALAAGTTINSGQGIYIMPALPPSATETGYALTGEDTSDLWQQPQGRWVNGINGQVFVPALP